MKITILQENLAKAVNVAARFTSTRTQLPILGNILISTQKSKVNICSTNLEISVSVSVGAKIEEEGELSVPSKVISDLVANFPKGTVDITSEKEQLVIKTTGFSSKVLGMNTSDFPKIPSSVNKNNSVVLPKEQFLSALSQVIFATSIDETRPILTGVLFVWANSALTLVATDGFRLSLKKIKYKIDKELPKAVLPKPVLSELSRIEGGEEIFCNLQEKEKQAVFACSETVLTSRLLEGDYPDFEKIIPKSSSLSVRVDKEDFIRAVKLASVFARDSANVVKIKALKETLRISSESGSSGSQETEVEAKVEGDYKNFETAYNFHFVEDFLHSAAGEEIEIKFTNTDKAGVFVDTSDLDYLHLIMPVKLQV